MIEVFNPITGKWEKRDRSVSVNWLKRAEDMVYNPSHKKGETNVRVNDLMLGQHLVKKPRRKK